MAPYISYEAGAQALTWAGALNALRSGHLLSRPEQGDLLLGPRDGTLLNRAAYIQNLGFVVKAETCMSANSTMGLPSIQGSVLYFDDKDGALRATIESRLITEYKTAGDSVLGAKLLARPDPQHIVIVGAGAMARTLIQAYSASFPSLRRISVWARRHEQARVLVNSLDLIGIEVAAVRDLAATLKTADIVSCATMAREPVIFGKWITPGTHIDLVGAFTPDMREADDELILKGSVFVDFFETTVDRIGELTQPIAAGVIGRDHVQGDLYSMVQKSNGSWRKADDQITVFKNGGGAHLDLMIAAYIVRALG